MSKRQILLIICVLSAIFAIFSQNQGYQEVYNLLKPLTTTLFICLAFFYGNRQPGSYWIYTVIGLIFCLIGDIFLLKDSFFLYGLVAFLIGHILFIMSFTSFDGLKKKWVPLILLLFFGIAFFGFISQKLGDMLIPVIVYMAVILFMCWQGISLYSWQKKAKFKWIAGGVIFFLISDSILALNKFVNPFEGASILVLTTYWLAIGMLAYATTVKMDKN